MEESLLEEKCGGQEKPSDDQQTKVWFPTPHNHRVIIISTIASIILASTGILLVWGPIVASVVCVLLIVLAIWIHFLRQKWIRLDQAILYLDRGELYIIFLNKKDTELDAYLHGQRKEEIAGRSPEEVLLDLAKLSVISHIPEVVTTRKKEDTTILFVSHRVIPYPYTCFMEIPISEKKYDNFDELLQIALTMAENRVVKRDNMLKMPKKLYIV